VGDALGEGDASGDGLGVGEAFFFLPDFGDGELFGFAVAEGSGVAFGLGFGEAPNFGEALGLGDALGFGLGDGLFAFGDGEGVGLEVFFTLFRFFGGGVGSKMRLIFVPNDSSAACSRGATLAKTSATASRPAVASLQPRRNAAM